MEKLKSASANFDAIKSRVTAVHPKEGERFELTHRGVNLKVLNIHRGRDVPIENLGFSIEMDGRTFFHIGDSQAAADVFEHNRLPDDRIDVAFIPYWYFLSDDWKQAIREQIRPRHIVWMHIPPFDQKDDYVESRGGWAKVLGEARAAFPAAVYFEREMERKAFD